jgi:hypothetical protein
MLRDGNECGRTKVMRILVQHFALQIMVEHKQPENVEYLNYLSGMVNDARCEIESGLPWEKQHSTRRQGFFHQQIGLKFKEETSKVLHLEHSCGAETLTLWKVDQKYIGSFEMCWRRMEKISWTNHVRNEEVL